MLVGEMGIGKTHLVNAAASILDARHKKQKSIEDDKKRLYNIVDLRCASQEPGDIIGIPRERDGRTIWSKAIWWPEPDTQGILFLDEVNRGPKDVTQCVFQLVSEWRMHTHILPEGWIIVAAINPDNNEYDVSTLDKAFLRRFCQIKLTTDSREWLRWAENYGINERIQKFIRENNKYLYVENNSDLTAFPTPEGYRMVDEMLDLDIIPKDENAKFEVIAGLVGQEAAATLMLYLDSEVEDCVSMQSILDDYPSVRDKVIEQSHDRMNKTIEEFLVKYEKHGQPSNTKHFENFIAFCKDLPPEYKASFIMSLKKNTELLTKIGIMDRELKAQLLEIRNSSR